MIYLDNAATTLEKPPAVSRAMCWAMRHAGGAGRSAHPPAMLGADIIYDTRRLAAQVFDVPDPTRVIFTANATQALNMALYAMAQTRRHFAISGFEHNAVYRPILELVKRNNLKLTMLHSALWEDALLLEQAEQAIRDGADCFVLCHVSNVFGYIQPLEQLDALLSEHGIPLVLDASQSAGVLPLSVSKLHSLAAVGMPGHKGLYAPPGTGMLLWMSQDLPAPLLLGGTGSLSEQADMPDFLPDRLESGTVNVAGIAGLFEGLQFVSKLGESEIAAWECKLRDLVTEKLREVPGVTVYASPNPQKQTGVLSFTCRQLPCEIVAQRLAEHNICVRAGLHCAPLAHSTAGTLETGTVRISPGWFQSVRQVRKFCDILAHICGKESDQICDEVFTH
ncbi:aminotransferase class V-fold PLP-dependent enzyme [Butyricicoccus intestinisimiae]|uniref:Aminotransferase class V-fold PLP-dependent enzyme n=1 Tax=Butyricicoccus intestinisimiae TaxID=2841509 RepID=A0ABS6ENG3_9FIRM|nr:aminotransferase class V-fold PLP-dependent enzyme [Butyricicoccus intestinisimiae]MBU5489242.1 aminotransferase class V-fold PLP-dependent enzyme [Butyricicoccus intestinisimiae]